ncbi:MAG: DMT family transporter, partial [Vibrio sp.]
LTTLLAGLGWIFSKEAIAGLPPIGFLGMRFLLASLFLFPFCYREFKQISWQQIRTAALVGGILGLAVMLWVYAISITSSLAEGAFISSLSMLMVPIVAWVLFKQTPARMFWASLPIAIGGLFMLAVGNGFHPEVSQIWFLMSALCLAIHFNFNAKYAASIPSLVLVCIQMFSAGIIASSVSLMIEDLPHDVTPQIWGWFFLSVILATSLRYVMQTLGQKRTTPGNAAIIMILEPVWASSFSVLWYGESLQLSKIIGCLLILTSLFVYRGGPRLLERVMKNKST